MTRSSSIQLGGEGILAGSFHDLRSILDEDDLDDVRSQPDEEARECVYELACELAKLLRLFPTPVSRLSKRDNVLIPPFSPSSSLLSIRWI